MYCLDLAVHQVVATLPKPDPTNLDTSPSVATEFAGYLRNNSRWGTAPLVLESTEDAFVFTTLEEIGATAWGKLTLPRLVGSSLKVIEGNSRLLGLQQVLEDLSQELDAARSGRTSGSDAETQIATINRERERIASERVALQIVVVAEGDAFEQFSATEQDSGRSQGLLARLLHPRGTASPMHMGQHTKALTADKRKAERERDDALAKVKDLTRDLSEEREAREKAEQEREDLREQFSLLASRPVAPAKSEETETEPPTITSVAEAVQAARGLPGLRFLDSADKTAQESPYERPEEAYNAFKIMSGLAAIRDGLGMKMEDYLANAGVEYAPHLGHEGSPTAKLKNKKYTFDVDGTDTILREHLKFGVSREPRHCLRIYMKWHAGEWVIGHVGKHL